MTLFPPRAESSKRIFGLDILRATAILVIIVYHTIPLLQAMAKNKIIGGLVSFIIELFLWVGPVSVDLFFVLSGFLIGTILIKVFLTPKQYHFGIIWEFWIKRWFRTLPNYFFLLTVAFLLYHYLYHVRIEWRYYLFLQNLLHPLPGFFAETWTISVEEWSYLLLPVVILLVSALFRKVERRQILKYTFIFYLLAFVIFRFIKIWKQDYQNMDEDIRKVVVLRLDSVLYGVLVGYCVFYYKELMYRIKNTLLYVGLAGVAIITLAFYISSHHPELYHLHSLYKIAFDNIYFTLVPLFFSLVLPASYFLKDVRPSFFEKMITHVSLTSYSLYLLHNTIIFIPFFLQFKNGYTFTQVICYYILYWVVLIGVATLNYTYFEKPTIRLRELFVSKSDSKALKV